jgi:demethylmenaquinone methyltransferase / 2-methoxy-6-polyprenyl-1,4-benzoquinol methylase
MPNSYYVPGEERARRVHDLFSRIARRYDLINDIQSFGLHRAWKQSVIRMAHVTAGERVLDLCTGTGDLAFAFENQQALVCGVDFTLAMLEQARLRNPGSAAQFIHGDALRLPFHDDSFDVVTIGYGLRNLASIEQGLREMLRVLKPRGRLLVLDFGKPPNSAWRAVYFLYLRLVVPIFGRLFCGDSAAYAYILESLKNYPAQEGVDAELRQLGCKNPQIHNFIGGVSSINYAERA